MDELQLRKTFLHVYVNHEEDRVGDIRFNLYLIATGPYHLDFPVKYTNKTVGRICVDVRISQIVETVISVQSATVTLVKERPAETFSFNIKTIVSLRYSCSVTPSNPTKAGTVTTSSCSWPAPSRSRCRHSPCAAPPCRSRSSS